MPQWIADIALQRVARALENSYSDELLQHGLIGKIAGFDQESTVRRGVVDRRPGGA